MVERMGGRTAFVQHGDRIDSADVMECPRVKTLERGTGGRVLGNGGWMEGVRGDESLD